MSGDELIRRVIRSETTWETLVKNGWPIERSRNGYVFGPTLMRPARIRGRDLAEGFIRVAAQSSTSQNEWATFILHASPVLDLSDLDDGATGSLMLDELWEMSAGHPVSEATLAAVREFLTKQAPA